MTSKEPFRYVYTGPGGVDPQTPEEAEAGSLSELGGAGDAAKCDDAEVMALWRKAGLPEYFLGNGRTNCKLVAFAKLLQSQPSPSPDSAAPELPPRPTIFKASQVAEWADVYTKSDCDWRFERYEAELASLREQLADERLVFEHANDVIGKLQADVDSLRDRLGVRIESKGASKS